jgi:dihydrolipoamide dehydrogenase
MEHFDVVVIGGGPSGYAAAMRAVDFDKRILLIEKARVGGAGIFDGALSSKTFWELSRETHSVNQKYRRYGMEVPKIGYNHVADEVNAAISERSNLLIEHMRLIQERGGNRFQFRTGEGHMLNPHEVEIVNGDERGVVHTDHIVLATGSRPRKLPAIPVDEKTILTSDGISGLDEFPESMVILGAGVIGCEFATIFSNFGHTKVHIIDKEPRILPFEDEDLARIVESNLEANGVLIHRMSKLKSMEVVKGKVEYVLTYADGHEEVFRTEKGLISVGRVPNMEGLRMKEVGMELTPSGHVVNDDTQSTVPNIWAVGDLTADIALVNVGELEGRHAIEKIYGKPDRPLIYENISTIMFLNPETAAVGMNEQQAQKMKKPYRAAIYEFSCIPRAVAMRRTQGFFKILVTDDDERKILGMRALGEHASSAIQAVALLISMDKGIEELAELIHPHPSIIEGVQEAVRMLLGKSIFKPSVFNEHLRYRRFSGGHYVEGDQP